MKPRVSSKHRDSQNRQPDKIGLQRHVRRIKGLPLLLCDCVKGVEIKVNEGLLNFVRS